MTSLNPHINSLLDAYNLALGVDLPMTATRERWLFEAHQAGMTPEDVALCLKERMRIKRKGGMAKGIEMRHVFGDEVRIDELLCEAALLRANRRIKVYSPAKAQALRDTGRPDAPPSEDGKHIAEYIQKMRKAAE